MRRAIHAGLLILAIQGVLVATVYWRVPGTREQSTAPFAPFAAASVDEIRVGDEFDNETTLRRAGDSWLLPDLGNLPADREMVDRLLTAITAGKTDWPVASSVAARQRFQVASYYYQRRIELLGQGKLLAGYLLGTSPAFRKVHSRRDDQDAIYSIDFNAFDAPGQGGAWLDRKLLQIRTPLRITADTYSLRRMGDTWQSGIDREPEARELEALLSALRSLQVTGIAGGDQQRELADAEPDLLIEVESLAGTVTLELFTLGESHFVLSSEYPLFFTLGDYDYDRLVNIDIRRISGEGNQD